MKTTLNLDSLQQLESEGVTFGLNGRVHTMREMTLGIFIKIAKMEERLQNLEPDDMVGQIELMMDIIVSSFQITREEVENMTILQMNAVINLLHSQGQPDEESAEAVGKETTSESSS